MASQDTTESSRTTVGDTTLLCDPCLLEDGEKLHAEGFCVDCSHFLCQECYKCHLKPLVWRHHHLLDNRQMPKTKPAPVYKDVCTDKCKEHENEIIKFYCEECKQFACRDCVILEHKFCKQVGDIPKLSKNLLQSQEYTSFKASLDSLAKKAATVLSEADSNIDAVNSQADQALEDIRKLKKEIDSYFDELEKEIVDKVEKSRAARKVGLEKISKQCEALSRDIGELQLDLTDKENKDQKCRLFVDTKQLLETLNEYDVKMRKLEEENKLGYVQFFPSDQLSCLVKDKPFKLGYFVRLHSRITIKAQKESCSSITGISVLSNNVVLADVQNEKIKFVDTENDSIATTKARTEFQFGITRVSDSEVAVMQGDKIVIYSVSNKPASIKKVIQTTGVVSRTLLYANNKFIVVADSRPRALREVDMEGGVVKTFPSEIEGKVLFDQPDYMTVNLGHTKIYVSDIGTQTVTCLTFDGEVRARHKPESGWRPRDVAVSRDGTVYVADSLNHNIHILSSDLQELNVIFGVKYGIKEPCGLAYCNRENKLYMGMWAGNDLIVLIPRSPTC